MTGSAGPVEHRRKYELWILILLVLFCWPAAIIYYFTRPEVAVQELPNYTGPIRDPQAMPPGVATNSRFCPYCGAQNSIGTMFCAKCGKTLG